MLMPNQHLTRRQMLARLGGGGLGLLGLGNVLFQDHALGAASTHPLAPKPPHFPAKAKRVIHIFCNGGASQMDTFDPKPALQKWAGKPLPLHYSTENPTFGAMPSPFSFNRYGQSGLECSEIFAQLAQAHADDLCVIRSMHTDQSIHENALMMMNTGSLVVPRPSLGSWITYGLGTENQNLPGYVVLVPKGLPVRGEENWKSSFLPGAYQGTYVATDRADGKFIDNLRNARLGSNAQSAQMKLLGALNQHHVETRDDDPALAARIHNYETAFRMQMEATDAFDLTQEPESIRKMYGDGPQNKQMLLARRLIERGVRFVQVWHGREQPWDSHKDLEKEHRKLAAECVQGITALLSDLKSRGMLEDTLVMWAGEFGRTPTAELNGASNGRDHNRYGFTTWMAGGGVKGGLAYGSTDEFGFAAVENRVHVHDLHATILHLMGFDHERLTYEHAGRNFRLTDVHGHVVKDLLS